MMKQYRLLSKNIIATKCGVGICMYVYIYMYIYVCIYMCIYVYVCVYVYMCMYICVYVCMCVCVHIYILKVYISFVARNLAQNGWKHKR